MVKSKDNVRSKSKDKVRSKSKYKKNSRKRNKNVIINVKKTRKIRYNSLQRIENELFEKFDALFDYKNEEFQDFDNEMSGGGKKLIHFFNYFNKLKKRAKYVYYYHKQVLELNNKLINNATIIELYLNKKMYPNINALYNSITTSENIKNKKKINKRIDKYRYMICHRIFGMPVGSSLIRRNVDKNKLALNCGTLSNIGSLGQTRSDKFGRVECMIKDFRDAEMKFNRVYQKFLSRLALFQNEYKKRGAAKVLEDRLLKITQKYKNNLNKKVQNKIEKIKQKQQKIKPFMNQMDKVKKEADKTKEKIESYFLVNLNKTNSTDGPKYPYQVFERLPDFVGIRRKTEKKTFGFSSYVVDPKLNNVEKINKGNRLKGIVNDASLKILQKMHTLSTNFNNKYDDSVKLSSFYQNNFELIKEINSAFKEIISRCCDDADRLTRRDMGGLSIADNNENLIPDKIYSYNNKNTPASGASGTTSGTTSGGGNTDYKRQAIFPIFIEKYVSITKDEIQKSDKDNIDVKFTKKNLFDGGDDTEVVMPDSTFYAMISETYIHSSYDVSWGTLSYIINQEKNLFRDKKSDFFLTRITELGKKYKEIENKYGEYGIAMKNGMILCTFLEHYYYGLKLTFDKLIILKIIKENNNSISGKGGDTNIFNIIESIPNFFKTQLTDENYQLKNVLKSTLYNIAVGGSEPVSFTPSSTSTTPPEIKISGNTIPITKDIKDKLEELGNMHNTGDINTLFTGLNWIATP